MHSLEDIMPSLEVGMPSLENWMSCLEVGMPSFALCGSRHALLESRHALLESRHAFLESRHALLESRHVYVYAIPKDIYIYYTIPVELFAMSEGVSRAESAGIRMSAGPMDLSSTVAPNDACVPMHIANLLKLIALQDKFNKVFVKWSLIVKADRDVLVLTLKLGALIDSSLVYTLCMMYPFRIHGPILMNLLMNIEFLHHEPVLSTVAIGREVAPHNVAYPFLSHASKRKRDETPDSASVSTSCSKSSTALSSASGRTEFVHNIASIRQKLHKSLQHTNNTRTLVKSVTTGVDVGGTWASFQIDQCDKLNLDFIGHFHLALDDMPIKV